jgi:hypothetical protein
MQRDITRKSFTILIIFITTLGIATLAGEEGGGIRSALGQQSIAISFQLNITNNSDQHQTVSLRFTSPNSHQNTNTGVEAHSKSSSSINMITNTSEGPITASLCTGSQCITLDPNHLRNISELNVRINADGSMSIS